MNGARIDHCQLPGPDRKNQGRVEPAGQSNHGSRSDMRSPIDPGWLFRVDVAGRHFVVKCWPPSRVHVGEAPKLSLKHLALLLFPFYIKKNTALLPRSEALYINAAEFVASELIVFCTKNEIK